VLECGSLDQMRELGEFLSRECELPLKVPTGWQQLRF
jgi:hypothetical protein